MIRLTITRPGRPPETVYYDHPAEVVVGRSARCAIPLDFDPMVSRMHAVFTIEPGRVRVKDLESTNGIAVNGEMYGGAAASGAMIPIELRDGDAVTIGGTVIGVEIHPADAPAAAPVRERPRVAPMPLPPTTPSPDGADVTMVNAFAAGQGAGLPHIPGYRLTRFLAVSRIGRIYLGVPNGEERRVAVRVMYPPGGTTPELLKVFLGEFDAARNVVHPNLVRLFGAGELLKGGGIFLATEYAAGEALTKYLERRPDGRLLSGEAVGIMMQIAGAICRLHRQSITHLDLKPESIIIREDDGRVVAKVTDVGLTDFAETAGLLPPAYTGNDVRRLAFLAPEQVSDETKAGMKTDVFTLAALLFAMIAGRSPYNFVEGGDNRLAVERGEALALEDVVDGVPETLLEIVRTGLARDPGSRYADACQFLAALEEMLM